MPKDVWSPCFVSPQVILSKSDGGGGFVRRVVVLFRARVGITSLRRSSNILSSQSGLSWPISAYISFSLLVFSSSKPTVISLSKEEHKKTSDISRGSLKPNARLSPNFFSFLNGGAQKAKSPPKERKCEPVPQKMSPLRFRARFATLKRSSEQREKNWAGLMKDEFSGDPTFFRERKISFWAPLFGFTFDPTCIMHD